MKNLTRRSFCKLASIVPFAGVLSIALPSSAQIANIKSQKEALPDTSDMTIMIGVDRSGSVDKNLSNIFEDKIKEISQITPNPLWVTSCDGSLIYQYRYTPESKLDLLPYGHGTMFDKLIEFTNEQTKVNVLIVFTDGEFIMRYDKQLRNNLEVVWAIPHDGIDPIKSKYVNFGRTVIF